MNIFRLIIIIITIFCGGCGSVTQYEIDQMKVLSKQMLRPDSVQCNKFISPLINGERCIKLVQFNRFVENKELEIDSIWLEDVPDYVRFYPNYKRQYGIRYRCITCPNTYRSISFFFIKGINEKLEFNDFIINYPQKLKVPLLDF